MNKGTLLSMIGRTRKGEKREIEKKEERDSEDPL